MARHPLRDLVLLAASGRRPPTVAELEELGLNAEQVAAVVAASKHAADLHAAGQHGAARAVGFGLEQWFPGQLADVGKPAPVDPLEGETNPRVLADAATPEPW